MQIIMSTRVQGPYGPQLIMLSNYLGIMQINMQRASSLARASQRRSLLMRSFELVPIPLALKSGPLPAFAQIIEFLFVFNNSIT